MFCTPSHFTPDTRPYFSDSVCKYGSVLMHTKVGDISWAGKFIRTSKSACEHQQMIICLFRPRVTVQPSTSSDQTSIATAGSVGGWAYVAGSHNLSQAAWVR